MSKFVLMVGDIDPVDAHELHGYLRCLVNQGILLSGTCLGRYGWAYCPDGVTNPALKRVLRYVKLPKTYYLFNAMVEDFERARPSNEQIAKEFRVRCIEYIR